MLLWTRQAPTTSIPAMDADREQRRRVGAQIRRARRRCGLSQGQLARRMPAPVDGGYISRWERGQNMPSWTHLRALAEALGVSVSWLLAEDEDEEPELAA